MVRKLLVVDPSQRMTIEEALSHTWLQDPVMLDHAHRLMYPPADAVAVGVGPAQGEVGAGQEEAGPSQERVGSSARPSILFSSSRKRRREVDEEEKKDHQAKRSQAPPSAQP
ncbi:hypothetical protein LDENG_00268170 [Lucifuga dentata]|nr:hypothetical protein LDENG_00268170 [Lucifuga dentata]